MENILVEIGNFFKDKGIKFTNQMGRIIVLKEDNGDLVFDQILESIKEVPSLLEKIKTVSLIQKSASVFVEDGGIKIINLTESSVDFLIGATE